LRRSIEKARKKAGQKDQITRDLIEGREIRGKDCLPEIKGQAVKGLG